MPEFVGVVLLVLYALYIYTLVLTMILKDDHILWLFVSLLDVAMIVTYLFSGVAWLSLVYVFLLYFHSTDFLDL